MAWTTPRTWATNELVTAALLNEQVRDNLAVLKNMPIASARYSPGGTLQITSTTFVDIHTSLNFSLTTNGGRLMMGVFGRVFHNPGINTDCFFDININGVSETASGGVAWVTGPNATQFPFAFTWLTGAQAAGAKTVKLQCRRGTGNTNPVQIFDIVAWVMEV
jgi:hypothetical protein